MRNSWSVTQRACLVLIAAGAFGLAASPSSAQKVSTATGGWYDRVVVDGALTPAESVAPLEAARSVMSAATGNAWTAFAQAEGRGWSAHMEQRSGFVAMAQGPGLPWVPGAGNRLTAADLAAQGITNVDLDAINRLAHAFLRSHAAVFGADVNQLRLRRSSSGQPAPELWFLDYIPTHGGLEVEGARIVLRINHGNLIQFGSEHLPPASARVPAFAIDRETARARLATHVGGLQKTDQWIDSGSRHLLATGTNSGFGIATVWQFTLHRPGQPGTFRARIDAESGVVREFLDINDYAQANGGTYQKDRPDPETVLPLPFTNLTTGGFTDSGGNFPAAVGAATTLSGKYVAISDTCGAISQGSDAGGNIHLGASAGTDCTTPGNGGAGNTHSARTQFYNLNRVREIGRGWLPANTWLQGQLTANVNIAQNCNAYWNGSSVNFFHAGGGCANTGELPGVSIHEYGHGLDTNDGNGSSPDNGTGETVGDFTAALFTHQSCTGNGFLASNCGGYGDACTACTGVRDIDWAKHVGGAPHNVDNFTRAKCPDTDPTRRPNYVGPCGLTFPVATPGRREGHCESDIASEALWDFANRDLPLPGTGSAWSTTDRLWYLSRGTATGAFVCTTGGSVAGPWTSDGCNAGSLWNTFRAVDDDDGNLANGTPHGAALAAAFDRHGIACTTQPGWNVTFAGCTPPATPTLSLARGTNGVDASWSNSGGGTLYDVYRNESGCNAGFIKIANDVAAVALSDTAVSTGLSYYYQVVAQPSASEACGSAPSTCQATVTGALTLAPLSLGGNNEVQLNWSNGSPASVKFRIERKLEACASPGAFTTLATGVSPTSYLDTTAPGTLTVAYRVVGTDTPGFPDSPASNCREIVPTGPCTAAPSFAGITSASDVHAGQCTVSVSWGAAGPVCAGPATYNVYRGAVGFTPALGNRIATGVTGTTYSDTGALTNGTVYEYVVRAVDTSNGLEEGNTLRRSRQPTGALQAGNLVETFEGSQSGGGFDLGGWQHHALSGGSDWTWSTLRSNSPTHSQFGPDPDPPGDRDLVSPSFSVQASTTLRFFHTYNFEFSTPTCWDGGTLEISTDGGTTWTVLPDAAFTGGGFNGTVGTTSGNPIGGKRAWCGGTLGTLTQVDANLAAFAGATEARLRWHTGSDANTAAGGWFVDSVTISNVQVPTTCSGSMGFYPLTPCRLLDTRNAAGPQGGPAIAANGERTFTFPGLCSIPATASALSVNVTIVGSTAVGNLVLYPADLLALPNTTSLAFSIGNTRANNAVLQLSASGVKVKNQSSATANVIVDVNGYFQ